MRLLFALLAACFALVPDAVGQVACPETCRLPACHCASADPPAGLAPADAPQFVLITVDDCVRPEVEALLAPVFSGLTNPDGRPLPRTYFASRTGCRLPEGATTDAATVRALYDAGHEIANHTERHDTDEASGLETWADAIGMQQRYLYDAVGLPPGAVRGFRAPFLRTNDAMYAALEEAGFGYDASLLEQPFHGASPVSTSPRAYVWPHTLDYGAGVSCGFFFANACPETPRPGLWTIPAWTFVDPDGVDADSAIYYGAFDVGTPFGGVFPIDGDRLVRLMMANFADRYSGNRAPYNLYLHATPFADPARQADVRRVLAAALAEPDVWAITMEGLLAWMQAPVPAREMAAWFDAYCAARGCPQPLAAAQGAGVEEGGAEVYPNPTMSDATLAVTHAAPGRVTLEVMDVLGRVVHRAEAEVGIGPRRYAVPLQSHPAGPYLVRLHARDRVLAMRLVTKR